MTDHAPTREASGLLDVRDLNVTYAGSVQVLHGVSVSVPAEGVVAVLGGNGAGKSTLLRAISGTLKLQGGATDGSISFDGRELGGTDPAEVVRAGVVQVPEGRRIFGDLTVEENLRAGGLTVRSSQARAKSRERVYEMFPRLQERRRQRAVLLSGGEQQMLAIGRALMSEPKLLLLDEPSLGLAPQVVAQIGEVIREINKQGIAIVLVEQNAAMALDIADRAYVLEVGRVTLEGPAAELAATDEVRDRYLGVGTEAEPVPELRPDAERATSASTGARRETHELAVEHVTVRFGGITALEDVSFTVAPGTVHAIIGPNGAGKSTSLNVLTGVYAPTEGTVRYGETSLTGLRPHRIARLGVSRTFQNLALSPGASVQENLLLGRHRMGSAGFLATGLGLPSARKERARQIERAEEVARILDLSPHLHRPVSDLPYGDRKRVELGRALCADPSVLLLDEPVAGMNHDETRVMARSIAEIKAGLGISIVLIEHDMGFVMGLADQVTVLDFGRCIADGPPAEVQRDPAVVAAYLGAGQTEGDEAA